MANLRKSVKFAYPTSDLAERHGKGKKGAYFVEVFDKENWSNYSYFGPYESVKDAEIVGGCFQADWCKMYKRHPLPDSQFENLNKAQMKLF